MIRRIVLLDTNIELVECWKRSLGDLKCVKISTDTLDSIDLSSMGVSETKKAAIVSPGNSFGWLGGGFDLALKVFFGGPQFESFFRHQLRMGSSAGYKPVQTTTVVELGTEWSRNGISRVIHAPTMVAPSRKIYDATRPVETGYSLVFNTLWNVFLHAPQDTHVLVVPGLATGYAGVPVEVCSKAMALAIRLFLASEAMSQELKNVVIMQFLGYRYDAFVFDGCAKECEELGINFSQLLAYDARTDPISHLLPHLPATSPNAQVSATRLPE
ncbi:LAFA_0F09362g1_1 [Lachancea sp. 'fantastica']|nr:LAFA_0F09362g1_1 [Lachancea sp. 'fantastica']